MFTPQENGRMPPLVDRDGWENPPFYPPPLGATDGGQPGIHSAFPGVRSPSAPGPSPYWAPPGGTPFAPPGQWPSSTSGSSSASGSSWPYSPNGWGTTATPGWLGSESAPPIPGAYPSQYGAQQHTPSPFFTGAPPPSTPYQGPQGPPTSAPVSYRGDFTWPTNGGDNNFPVSSPSHRSRKHSGEGLHHSSSMRRSNSRGALIPQRPGRQRSVSFSNNGYPTQISIPAYARGDLFDEDNLAKRPSDWRPDYTSPNSGYLDALRPAIIKHKTTIQDWSDPVRREHHPLLQYRSSYPPLYFDLRAPQFYYGAVSFLTLERPANQIDFMQLALNPPYEYARLFHPRLPWYVDVFAGHQNGVTIEDMLSQLLEQLQTPIHGRHYYNEALTVQDRHEISHAFQSRCRAAGDQPGLIARGVLQVDFLGDKCILEGLAKGPKGMWEIKTRKPNNP